MTASFLLSWHLVSPNYGFARPRSSSVRSPSQHISLHQAAGCSKD